MRDPFAWSFWIGRLFGIGIRIHWLFPVLALGLIFRYSKDPALPLPPLPAYTWVDATILVILLFFVILLHEFGHCLFAHWMNGEAREVLLWPLGGLASVDIPHHHRAHFWTAAGGPLTNLVICAVAALVLGFAFTPSVQPPWNIFTWYPFRYESGGKVWMDFWGAPSDGVSNPAIILFARLFYVSWLLFLFNIVLVGYPMDSGRILQSILWPYVGYRQATLYAIYAGFGMCILLSLACMAWNEVMLVFLVMYIGFSCMQEYRNLENGGEDSLFGYDFSQGYTSLERDNPSDVPQPKAKKLNFIQRWLKNRQQKKMQRDEEQRVADEKRMDELLEKIQRFGKQSLTDEEQRFLKKVADRYRNRS
jgi:stage IV sporulation protein FB